ncbi:MAG TPA: hypothetical protein VEW48_19815 [Thermoanaerobaculia bacterium]|nr:hypothetical protein [Thermoanaerobaculia bacterium]
MRGVSLLIVAILLVLGAKSTAAQSPLTGTPAKEAPGERIEVTIFNASPATALTIDLTGVRFLGVAPKLGQEKLAPGVSVLGGRIVFRPPAGSIPEGETATATFAVWAEISGPVEGRVTLAKPEVLLVETSHGTATLQEGTFRLAIPAMPGNCVLAGCREGYASCPKDPLHDMVRTCQQFLDQWLCCAGSPIPIV